MNFISALAVFLILGALLVAGIVLASKGIAWLLLAGIAVFAALFVKFGCLDQH